MTLLRHLLTICVLTVGFASDLRAADDEKSQPGELFQSLDADNDGKLVAEEIPEKQQRYFKRLLRVGDADRNQELTREEFVQALQSNDRPVTLPGNGGNNQRRRFDPGQAFTNFDRNQDGKLARDELPDQLRERLDAAFERLGKKSLTQQEFVLEVRRLGDGQAGARNGKQLAQMFKRMDADGDGKVTLAEAPERARDFVRGLLRRAGKNADDALTSDDLKKIAGMGAPAEGRKPTQASTTSRPQNPTDRPPRTRESDRPQPFRRPAFMAMLDADADGELSQEELAQAGRRLLRLDRNRDGRLDLHELMGPPPQDGDRPPRVQSRTFPDQSGTVRRTATYVFEALDTNKDGTLSLDEWSKSRSTRTRFERAGVELKSPVSLEEFTVLFGRAAEK
ncbi:MAG: hypothetical protein CMJ48_04785 [Planctomycetaceae bacterium]|nr:hypothetical protein [Planctomycetaceae bacterium]